MEKLQDLKGYMEQCDSVYNQTSNQTTGYASMPMPRDETPSENYLIERDQDIRIRAVKIWLEFILSINKLYGGQPYIPTSKEFAEYIELFGNYILNGKMEMENE